MTAGFPCAALSADNWVGLALWCAVVLAGIALLGVGMLWAKKYAARSIKGHGPSDGELTIERLEEMRRSGLISREEFSSLRRAALGLGPAAADRGAPAQRAPRNPAGSKPAGDAEPEPPKPALTQRPSDVDENMKSQPPGEPPGSSGSTPPGQA